MKANYSRFLAVDKTLTPLKEHYKGFAIIDHPTVLQVFYQYHLRLKWEHLFLFLATYCLFSCWRHIHKQYLTMAFPRPEQVVVDVESVVRDYLRPATAHSPPGDLPPKYEEVQAAAAAQVGATHLKCLFFMLSPFRLRKRRHLHRSTTSRWQWGQIWRGTATTQPLPCLCLLQLSSKSLPSVIYLMQEKYIHIHPVIFHFVTNSLTNWLVGHQLVGLLKKLYNQKRTNWLEKHSGPPLDLIGFEYRCYLLLFWLITLQLYCWFFFCF